jgi:hypothetical protein
MSRSLDIGESGRKSDRLLSTATRKMPSSRYGWVHRYDGLMGFKRRPDWRQGGATRRLARTAAEYPRQVQLRHRAGSSAQVASTRRPPECERDIRRGLAGNGLAERHCRNHAGLGKGLFPAVAVARPLPYLTGTEDQTFDESGL